MKKNLSFIPLGIGISAAIIYLFNVFRFRIISNSATLLQILSSLKIYLYISIGGFILYFLIKILDIFKNNNDIEEANNNTYKSLSNSELYKSVKSNTYPKQDLYEPNYDYVPLYKENNYEKKQSINQEFIKQNTNIIYCNICGEQVLDSDMYCKRCGASLKNNKSKNTLFKKIINLLEIIILILILYFLLNMLFDYKEKHDSNFKSPFNIAITK